MPLSRFKTLVGIVSAVVLLPSIGLVAPRAQEGGVQSSNPFEAVLDVYVRDGYVYYRALKQERAKLDAYVSSLGSASIDAAPREQQEAFWLNAYDAFVLRTVIDHYPIAARTKDYPAQSIRQVPGAFERLPHRAAGRNVTLDEIEKTILAEYHDPRLYFALGRGSIGGGRLRSEPFDGSRLEAQLAEVAAECASRPECVQIDIPSNKLSATAIFSWHEKEFVDAYAQTAPPVFAARSPIEKAIIAFIQPKLLATEKELLEHNQFTVAYQPFDWRLNNLTGRGGR